MRYVLGLVLVVVVAFAIGAIYARLVGPGLSIITATMLGIVVAGAALVATHDWIDRALARRRRRIPAPARYLSRNRWGRR